MDRKQQLEMAQKLRENVVGTGSALQPSSSFPIQRQEVIVPTTAGDTRVLIYTPESILYGPLPVYINMHGGGFIFGKAEMDDPWCRLIAHRAGCIVVNIDYSLAPEHKFPTAVHECYDVVKWVHEHPEQFSINSAIIAIGGHSAGGNLAAAVCLLNQQRGSELPIVFQIIDYAPLDLVTDPALKPSFEEAIPAEIAKKFNSMYLESSEDARSPLASPIFADSLHALPETLVITAEKDSLAAEGREYAEKLKQNGVKVLHKQYEGATHGFTHYGDLAVAEEVWHLMSDKLREAFSNAQKG
ncbi:acetyl esterase [Paenibacillus algorifonticola]|uniref:Acetyl esterase n=1 Tax=Paenibacillus algorifonticola TaxID=684063 RepID=A0A1I1YZ69_9BACL|nr:alpha/beta hydrolase [Paenibacillus algorifonticola]SFE23473.1 acetyl esterase [Paenibacillus algorifonticola]